MIYAKIIEDSISEAGKRIMTFELSYPRIIHGEVMTHRVFSRNAMSSRAIPVAKMIEQVRTNPFVPLHWGVNQPGMQASVELQGVDREYAIDAWQCAARAAANQAGYLAALNVHKQVVNRLLEPFQWMRTILTGTEFDNFFALRDHPDAEPHFQLLARAMKDALHLSTPMLRGAWDSPEATNWHLPYILPIERAVLEIGQLCKVSTARCARVSYLTHEGKEPSMEADLALYERLAGSVPIHASPLEHQARSQRDADVRSGNFRGWWQYRQTVV